MSLLGGFEQRLERAVEGFFARVFRSGVHPVEIGKRLLRVMEDGKTDALKSTYAPSAYRITLSDSDYDRLAPLEPKLVEELEVFISQAAKQRGWSLTDAPRVSFGSNRRLSPGEFKIEAEPVSVGRAPAPDRAATQRRAQPRAPRPVSTGKPTLVVLGDGGAALRTVPISGRVRLGRQADNDIVLPDPGVSRHHAEVLEESGGWCKLRDLGSTNGTLVNGATVTEHRLQDGDRFQLGNTLIEFRRS